jgi:hypothetical protein
MIVRDALVNPWIAGSSFATFEHRKSHWTTDTRSICLARVRMAVLGSGHGVVGDRKRDYNHSFQSIG